MPIAPLAPSSLALSAPTIPAPIITAALFGDLHQVRLPVPRRIDPLVIALDGLVLGENVRIEVVNLSREDRPSLPQLLGEVDTVGDASKSTRFFFGDNEAERLGIKPGDILAIRQVSDSGETSPYSQIKINSPETTPLGNYTVDGQVVTTDHGLPIVRIPAASDTFTSGAGPFDGLQGFAQYRDNRSAPQRVSGLVVTHGATPMLTLQDFTEPGENVHALVWWKAGNGTPATFASASIGASGAGAIDLSGVERGDVLQVRAGGGDASLFLMYRGPNEPMFIGKDALQLLKFRPGLLQELEQAYATGGQVVRAHPKANRMNEIFSFSTAPNGLVQVDYTCKLIA